MAADVIVTNVRNKNALMTWIVHSFWFIRIHACIRPFIQRLFFFHRYSSCVRVTRGTSGGWVCHVIWLAHWHQVLYCWHPAVHYQCSHHRWQDFCRVCAGLCYLLWFTRGECFASWFYLMCPFTSFSLKFVVLYMCLCLTLSLSLSPVCLPVCTMYIMYYTTLVHYEYVSLTLW